MFKQYIKFSSITYAQKARDYLYRSSINSTVGRNPNPKGRGCAYVLYVSGNIEKAYELITAAGIKNSGIEAGGAG